MNRELEHEQKLTNDNNAITDQILATDAALSALLQTTTVRMADHDEMKKLLNKAIELKKRNLPMLREQLHGLVAVAHLLPAEQREMLQQQMDIAAVEAQQRQNVAELECAIDALIERQRVRIKVGAIRPELETLMMQQQTMAMQQQQQPQTIEQQQQALKKMEEHKHKLDSLIAQLPSPPTADDADDGIVAPLREQCGEQLRQIDVQIRELGEMLGRKMALAAQFHAAHSHAIEQFDLLQRELAELTTTKPLDVVVEKQLQTDAAAIITALETREHGLEQLENKLRHELPIQELEMEQQQQLDQIHNSLQQGMQQLQQTKNQLEASELIGNNKYGLIHACMHTYVHITYIQYFLQLLQQRIAEAARKAEQQAQLREVNGALIAAVQQARDALADPAIQPQLFEQQQASLSNAMANAQQQQQLVMMCTAAADDDAQQEMLMDTMQANMTEAEAVQQQLATRWQHWQEFVQHRDQASTLLDLARKQIELAPPQRQPADVAEHAYEHLLVSLLQQSINRKSIIHICVNIW